MRLLDNGEVSKAVSKDAAELLLLWMEFLSEKYFLAGWIRDLEYDLWNCLQRKRTRIGDELEERDVAKLFGLWARAGGWWRWASEDNGPVFVTTKEWREIAKERDKRDAQG
jgi:hypothetical protein